MENKLNNNSEFHPCQYCGNSCKGLQCRNCHFATWEKKKGNCIECSVDFYALKIDGTKKQRCYECQNIYNQKYIKNCPICGENYHATAKDGRTFDKCYKCYQQSFSNCEKCGKRCLEKYTLCRECHQETKECNDFIDPNPIHDCKTKDCKNKSPYTFCKECYTNFNFVNDSLLSICEKCGIKKKGKFYICYECKGLE